MLALAVSGPEPELGPGASKWRQFQQIFIMQINFTLFIAVSDGIPCINFREQSRVI